MSVMICLIHNVPLDDVVAVAWSVSIVEFALLVSFNMCEIGAGIYT